MITCDSCQLWRNQEQNAKGGDGGVSKGAAEPLRQVTWRQLKLKGKHVSSAVFQLYISRSFNPSKGQTVYREWWHMPESPAQEAEAEAPQNT